MRRSLTMTLAAAMAAVVLALTVPLAILLRTLAHDRALSASTERQLSVIVLALKTPDKPDSAVVSERIKKYLSEQPAGSTTTLYVNRPDVILGDYQRDDSGFQKAVELKAPYLRVVDGTVISYRIVKTTKSGPEENLVVRDAVSPELLNDGVFRSLLILTAITLALLAAAVMLADRLAKRVSGPIDVLARQAHEMSEGNAEARVRESGPREVVELGRALNSMQERFRRLLTAERDAVADLSHRLRTPVTALRLDTEMIDDPEVSERVRAHVTQLERTVDAIVHDARRPIRAESEGRCDAAKVVSERVAFWSALAEEQDRPLRTAVPDRILRVKVSENDLSDVVDVLLDNVFAHTDDGVPIEVWLVPRADGAIVLTVEDGGPGLPEGDIVARGSSGRGSSGLGLDIARRAAMASGGWLELGQSRLGGALVRVVLGRAS